MGNCLTKCKSCFNSSENPAAASSLIVHPPVASSSAELPEELQECIDLFKEIEDTDNIDELINMIEQLLQTMKSKQQSSPGNASRTSQLTHGKEEKSMWTSIVNKGSTFLTYLHRFGSSEKLDRGIKVIAETLQQVGQINSMLGVLSTIAYVLSKYEKMRDNQLECLTALEDLIDLARHIRNMKKMVPEDSEKFTKAIQLIVEGSITCLCQLEENTLFRFIESSVNFEKLTKLQKRISDLYPNLVLTSIMDIRKDIATCLPRIKPIYPDNAVGIEVQVNEIVDILRNKESSLAVVIYGFGGLGKTTLANAVVSKMDLQDYNYTSLELHQEQGKHDFTKLQRQVLIDCFPDYNGGIPIVLRDCEDGQSHLMQAFKCKKNKPIFIFIDNALRSTDLESLLPLDLRGLPKGSKILITTRFLPATDILLGSQPNQLARYPYPLNPLLEQDALEILFKDPSKLETVKDGDIERILRICCGVPLALKIVGAHLHKQNYSVKKCADILENLEEGYTIKEEKLSERLIDFVYGELEEYIQEALLDICCFFNEWHRHEVEYMVGATAVTSLIEAGLITLSDVDDHNWVDDKLTVHDIIRANGQGKAKGNRILDIQSFREAADRQRLDQVKGVWLVNNTSEYVIEERQLNLMRDSLRVLVLGEGIKVSWVSQMSFKQLKFLGIFSSLPQLPVKLEQLDKLRVFHGPPSFFFEGEVCNLSKLPRNLKSLKVISQFSEYLFTTTRIMIIGACSSLEKLDLSGLGEPPKLSEGFNQLEALEILILDGNDKMCEFPGQICQLSSLKALSLKGWRDLKCLPESLEQLTNLLYLNLSGCEDLQQLPDTFGQLANLMYLDLHGCRNLKLPDTFGKLAKLKYLNLGYWIVGPLPRNFGQLRSLQHLRCAEELKGEVQVLIDNGVLNGSRLTLFFYTQEYRERAEKLRVNLLVSKAAFHFIDAGMLQGNTF